MSNFKKIAQSIYKLIEISNPIIIHRHINPDGDALGSQWGLKTIIEDNFKNKTVFVPGEINKYMLSFFSQPSLVKKEYYKNSLVIVTDTANRERISGKFWKNAQKIIKIDHHPVIDNYGDINLIDEKATATCQLIAKWSKLLNLKVSNLSARNLFFGLVTDSNRFLYKSVSEETFQIASFLVKKKFNLFNLYQNLYIKNIKIMRVKGYILSNFKVTNNGVAYIIFTNQIINKLQNKINNENKKTLFKNKVFLSIEDLSSQVNVMSNIRGIKIWLIAVFNEFNTNIKVSIRSSKLTINNIISKFGGGGHETAAGVDLKNIKDLKKLINNLDKFCF